MIFFFMSVIFIEYKKLHENRSKRILFLDLIFKLSNLEGLIPFNTLSLNDDDLDAFKELILEAPYKNYFVNIEKSFQIVDNIDGKILSDIDVLADDLRQINIEIEKKHSLVHVFKEINLNNLDSNDLETFFKDIYPYFLLKWLFKEINLPLIPFDEDGLEIFKNSLDNLNRSQIKEIFDKNVLIEKVQNLPDRIEQNEIDVEDFKIIQKNVLNVLNYVHKNIHLEPYADCSTLKKEIIKHFDSLRNYSKIPFTLLPGEMIFLVEKGISDLENNPFISYYQNKIVLFRHSIPLTKTLKSRDVVLCDIYDKKPTFLTVDPKKKLNEHEILVYLIEEIEYGTSKSEIKNSRGISHE